MMPMYRVPLLVESTPTGLRMTYVGLRKARQVLTPWEKVQGVEIFRGNPSPRSGCWNVTYVPGGRGWYTNSFWVEPDLLQGWLRFLPSTLQLAVRRDVASASTHALEPFS